MATPSGVDIRGPIEPGFERVLSPAALEFMAGLERRFRGERERLLARRAERQARVDAGEKPDFPAETRSVREEDWRVAPAPADLCDRRVEITGPVERKMIVNALNSGANVFMADFEDACAPTWSNLVQGQANLRDAVRRTIDFTDPASGKHYALADETAVLIVRPRGLHLPEKHVLVDGRPVSGALFDFALYFFHNAHALIERGTGPYFYLPKLESRLESRFWNEVFMAAQSELGLVPGTIKATVLIETLPAAFEMDEILYEMRDHIVGLNCGRWDYIFSYIKTLRGYPAHVLPDRAQVTMTVNFLRAYSLLLIKICHRRGAHAMGGMAAQIPIKGDEAANRAALDKVREDKLREVTDGNDGTWVAHPGLVAVAKAVFDEHMPGPNQLDRARPDVEASAADLLAVPEGGITEAGLRQNVNVAICYVEAWLRGNGCVPLYNLMEDAATAEISRAQVWQWLHHGARLEDGRPVTLELVETVLGEELGRISGMVGEEAFDGGRYREAAGLFMDLTRAEALADFLTLPAYERILTLLA